MSDTSDKTGRPKPVVLCILDGWGDRGAADDNAIHLAETPTWDRMREDMPYARLDASAQEVGLPQGQMGNSEVGHMNLGAGRIVMQDLPKIDAVVKDGSLAENPHLKKFINDLKTSGGVCHLLGLLSPGGVHSHQAHMAALARAVTDAGVPVVLHAFLDGRDTPPESAKGYMQRFLRDVDGLDGFSVGTVTGRYWAMDRDKRWDRVAKAYKALVSADAPDDAEDAVGAIELSYAQDKTDEFMEPHIIAGYAGMNEGDGLLCANFRADRAREILAALVEPAFDGFARDKTVTFAGRLGMVEYSKDLDRFMLAMFPSESLTNILGQITAEAGLKQLRIAETEKYAHVTFFLNGGREEVFEGEERILVQSPRVATYDLQPEMSAPEVTDNLVRVIGEGAFDLIIVNYANGDMVGHTGILKAAITAAETIDACLARLEKAVTQAGGVMLVTADHGNCEQMSDSKSKGPHTAHTMNLVPAILVNAPGWVSGLHDGRLADVAPTLLQLLGLEQPDEMTGRSLIDGETDAAQAAAE
ncbi:MAG: 2,3-bisphosphoglycerate-independent phosphoglycerate mutase [Rhodospirillaceae bacterium]